MLNKKSTNLFENLPIWKSLIKTSFPAMIMMLSWGLYSFIDSLLSINLAYSNYEHLEISTGKNAKDLVRIFMSSFGPIGAIMFGFSMLTASAISRRYSIQLGAKNKQRAIQVLQTTTMSMITISIILVPILLLTTKPWIFSIYLKSGYENAKIIANESYKYYWIIIVAYPINTFNRICQSILSSEAKNKRMLFATIIPMFFNLLFDYILMGPFKMGIQGGAIASLISFFITSIILIIFIIKSSSKISKFKNMFGFKHFRWLILLGCLLVGMPALIGEFAFSFVQTITIKINQEVSNSVYGDPTIIIILTTATNPIVFLFFPTLWAVTQGARPIIGYNYGSKNFKRVRQTVFWTATYTFLIGLTLYLISTLLFAEPLFKLFGLSNKLPNGKIIPIIEKAKIILKIIMLSLLFLAPLTASIALFSSTDRIGFSLLSTILRNVVVALIMLYTFKYFAQTYPGDKKTNMQKIDTMFSAQYIFLWKNSITILLSGLIIIWPMFYTLKHLDIKHEQLEDKINRLISKFEKKIKKYKKNK